MKKLLLIISAITLLSACSGKEEGQDYTSFVFKNSYTWTLTNSVVGIKRGVTWMKVASLGDIAPNQTSGEIIVRGVDVTHVTFFCDVPGPSYKINKEFTLVKNVKNVFEITGYVPGVWVDPHDSSQYPCF